MQIVDLDGVGGVLSRVTGEHGGEDGRASGENNPMRVERHRSRARLVVVVDAYLRVAHPRRRVQEQLREVPDQSFETTCGEIDALALVELLILGLFGDGIVHDRDAHVDLQLVVVERFILDQGQRVVLDVVDESTRVAALVDGELRVFAHLGQLALAVDERVLRLGFDVAFAFDVLEKDRHVVRRGAIVALGVADEPPLCRGAHAGDGTEG